VEDVEIPRKNQVPIETRRKLALQKTEQLGASDIAFFPPTLLPAICLSCDIIPCILLVDNLL